MPLARAETRDLVSGHTGGSRVDQGLASRRYGRPDGTETGHGQYRTTQWILPCLDGCMCSRSCNGRTAEGADVGFIRVQAVGRAKELCSTMNSLVEGNRMGAEEAKRIVITNNY